MTDRSLRGRARSLAAVFFTYLGRELSNRRRQTIVIAIGMALAIALVILVNAVSAGVKNAQDQALQSVYGVGTDITVTEAATAPNGSANPGQSFTFGSGAGRQSGNNRNFSSSSLRTDFGTTAFADTAVAKAAATSGVKAATGVLALRSTSFSGQTRTSTGSTGGTGGFRRGEGGGTGGGFGGGSFGITQTSVLGYDVQSAAIGPLTAATLTKGRTLTASDTGKDVALLDSDYATSDKKTVGSTLTLGGKTFTVVGIVKSTATSGASASNVYIPLDTAQTLSSDTGKISSVYVEATSASDISSVQTALQKSLGSGVTVNTESDLASDVSGSLGTAGTLASTLGLWLSVLALVAAFLLAVLFTISGVTRRTREFGTLKAIGWRDRRIVGQVAGESVVQGLIGGAIGIALGLVAILVVNLIHPVLTATTAATTRFGGGGGFGGSGGAGGGGFGEVARRAAATGSSIALSLPVTGQVIVLAVALAVVGGLIAGALGGLRAARLRPAAALRSVA